VYLIKESVNEKNWFIDFIKTQINIDLTNNVEETKMRGIIAFYTKTINRNTLVDIARLSHTFKKYKIMTGGANRIDIIFPNSKFWKAATFDWSPMF
jgi:hypothetical protein